MVPETEIDFIDLHPVKNGRMTITKVYLSIKIMFFIKVRNKNNHMVGVYFFTKLST